MESEEGSLGASAGRGLAKLTSAEAVRRAIAEFDELGRDRFLSKYGFGRSRNYFVVVDGRRYDSKAIVGAAHGFEHPELGPLTSNEFSGGESTVRQKLEALGFDVVTDKAGGDWSRERFLGAIDRLQTSTVGGLPAPHKPLLVLLALARWQSEQAEELSFPEIAEPLSSAIRAFVPDGVREVDSAQPFWRLQTDGIWSVVGEGLPSATSSEPPSQQRLNAVNATGGFEPGIYQLLESDTELVWDAAARVAATYFPDRQADAWAAVDFPEPPTAADPWDEFVYWAGRIRESDEYRAAEPEWKRSIGNDVAQVRDAMRSSEPDWPTALKRAFRTAGVVDFRAAQTFTAWVSEHLETARSALAALWDDDRDIAARLTDFLTAVPLDVVRSAGARASIASFLLMGSDPNRFVIYRPTPFDTAYRLTREPRPPTGAEVDRLRTAWLFLDTLIEQARARGVDIEDRIDAQSLVWSIAKNSPPESWSSEDQRAFLQYRSDKDIAMSQALTVYLGNSSLSNREYSLDKGKWGWKQTAPDYDAVEPGNLILLASGFSGGNVRVQREQFAHGGFSRVDIGRVTSRVTEETVPYWPDETADGTVRYPHRVALELIETRSDVAIADLDAEFGGDVGEGIRRSAIGGNGVLVEIEHDPFDGREPAELAEVVETFAAACVVANLNYGHRHHALTRTFITSLATKRFVILTGLSGSGKTRLAMALGQWFGSGHWTVVPVRPDWTSPDALFGYENGLSAEIDGHRAWQVPATLEFMLRAAADPARPYLLILDEMNLAHVERYFADVLSGMESDEPILPNLQRNGAGEWRPIGQPLPLPSNLFVVGTVNVDETTYMFSPKVLDRANTIEFRVETTDLSGTPGPLQSINTASPNLVTSFLSIATTPPDLTDAHAALGDTLRELHGLLAVHGREFGHRTFSEALRFAALYQLAGGDDSTAALDLQVLQKVLPKFHGSVREISEPLTAVAAWAFAGPGQPTPADFDPLGTHDAPPALPLSFEKAVRMVRRLRANHFVSFTE